MSYSAAAVANYFIEKNRKEGIFLSNMKIQKMIFFAHAIYTKKNEFPLVSDPVAAWKHGPVFDTLYHELKQFGDGNITEPVRKLQYIGNDNYEIFTPQIQNDDDPVVQFLNKIWKKLSTVETWRLCYLSHQEGGAWYKTLENFGINPLNNEEVENKLPRNLTILDKVIMECGK